MKLEILMLSKTSQTQKDMYQMFSLICGTQREKGQHEIRRETVREGEGTHREGEVIRSEHDQSVLYVCVTLSL
jgi:hypothetical protein